MKPANFPARVHGRRLRALKRLEAQQDGQPNCKMTRAERMARANVLDLRLNSQARAVRTKKDRISQARVSR